MNCAYKLLVTLFVFSTALLYGCSSKPAAAEDEGSGSLTSSRGEHDRDGGDHDGEGGHDEEGEEDATEYGLDDTYDQVRRGARLILAYDADSNSFKGTVENTTEETLEQVRVEVHLSNGTELGPTRRVDLGPGESRPVILQATEDAFDGWTAHPEVGSGEH